MLKELPNGLKYAFLGCNDTKLVIISSKLDNEMEVKLLGVLERNSEAFTWSIEDIKGISPSICMHKILMEEDHAPSIEHQRRLNPTMKEVMKKEVLKWLQAGFIYAIFDRPQVSLVQCVSKMGGMTMVRNEKNELLSTRVVTRWRVCIDYRKLDKATRKDHYPLPFLHQMLDRLAGHSHYCFLDGYSRYNQIMVSPEDQEKTTFKCLYRTFAFKRMSFRLCNVPTTFKGCMIAIFSDLIKNIMDVFMDDFSKYGGLFDNCLTNLEVVLQKCHEKNPILNWEKCHFMEQEGIVLGHLISSKRLEVDKANIATIQTLTPPTMVQGVLSFLGHAGFYLRFIKDFSKITKSICKLLEKDMIFNFNEACMTAFDLIKNKLIEAPIVVASNWGEPFQIIMCDASDYAVGDV